VSTGILGGRPGRATHRNGGYIPRKSRRRAPEAEARLSRRLAARRVADAHALHHEPRVGSPLRRPPECRGATAPRSRPHC